MNIENNNLLKYFSIDEFNALLDIGFPRTILDIVKLVINADIDKSNWSKDEILFYYNQKIESIINSGNIHAIKLKETDMSDNYDLERLKTLSEEQQNWFHEKYGIQMKQLRKILKNRSKV